ncbi:MAG: choice-of-anchor V domain-containing protein [Pyrinomonadaceae bacterium]
MTKSTSKLIYAKYAVVAFAALIAIAGISNIGSTVPKTNASASGPSPAFTGAPIENNCTACHTTFPVNSGTGNVAISGLPANYLPGQTVPLTVTVSDANAVIYGFQMVAINNAGENVGTLNLPVPGPELQLVNGFVNGNQRRYIEHTNQGVTPTQFGSKTWNFTWTAPATRIGKLSFYAAGNGANSDGGSSNDQIYTTSRATLSGSAIANFDTDTKSDISVYRPSTGVWYALTNNSFVVTPFGEVGDITAPGDYDGDGKTDHTLFRPSNGTWYIKKSTGTFVVTQFGASGDIPVPGDYDGDAKNDLAVWRPSNSTWYVLGSTGIYRVTPFGESTDKTAQGDYDADGKTDIAVFRQSTGTWYMLTSNNPSFVVIQFGVAGDLPVQADYDGDGKTDISVFRPSNGTWYTINATRGFYFTAFGVNGDKPAPADFDGDGLTDIAVFRPSNGTWYILGTQGPSYTVVPFGVTGDIPVASKYIAD